MLLDLLYSEDIDIKDLEKYFLASSQGQAPGFSPKNFITFSPDLLKAHYIFSVGILYVAINLQLRKVILPRAFLL